MKTDRSTFPYKFDDDSKYFNIPLDGVLGWLLY